MPFVKGQSGNPGGRPKGIREIARKHADKAMTVLAEALKHKDWRIRLDAAKTLLDRGYGKPTQPIAGDEDMAPIQQRVRIEFVDPDDQDSERVPGTG